MRDVRIAQTICLIIGCDTLVVLVILVEIIRSQHKEILFSLTDILHFRIGQMVLPGTDLCLERTEREETQQERHRL